MGSVCVTNAIGQHACQKQHWTACVFHNTYWTVCLSETTLENVCVTNTIGYRVCVTNPIGQSVCDKPHWTVCVKNPQDSVGVTNRI